MASDAFGEAVHEGDLAKALFHVHERPLESFLHEPVDIAVVGEAGAGKSSFINALRGLREEDEGAAETGLVGGQQDPMPYRHPGLPLVTLWELPGVETPLSAPQKEPDLSHYDFFIIVGSQRFRSAHANLAHSIEGLGRRFFFVRTKVDLDLEASRRQRPGSFNEAEVLHRIWQDCDQGLRGEGVAQPQVFVVANWEPNCYNFPLLQEILKKELPAIRRQASLLRHLPMCSRILDQKQSSLMWEVWKVTLLSSLLAALPIPGLSFICTYFLFQAQLARYCKSFGLDERSLAALAWRVGQPVGELQAVREHPGVTRVPWLKLMADAASAAAILVGRWKGFTIVGCLVSAGLAFIPTYALLRKAVRYLAKDTQKVLHQALKAEGKKSM